MSVENHLGQGGGSEVRQVEQHRDQDDAQQVRDTNRVDAEHLNTQENDPAQRSDVVGHADVQQALATENDPKVLGIEKSEEAVATANQQQDNAERWQDFSEEQKNQVPIAQGKPETAIPNSTNDATINVGDMLNRMKIEGGKIGA